MHSRLIVPAIAALCLGLSGSVYAQSEGDNPIHSNAMSQGGLNTGANRSHRPDARYQGQNARARDSAARQAYGGDQRGGRGGPGYDRGRGAGPDHSFYRGGRLPTQYRSRQYVVDDWRGHHLSSPPRGYQWVQTGADYVLVAVATGIIAELLLGN